MNGLLSLAQVDPAVQRRVDAATVEQRRAVQLAPRSAEAYAELARAYDQNRFKRAASEAWAIAIQLDPTDAEAYRQYGVTVRTHTPRHKNAVAAWAAVANSLSSDGYIS